MLNRDATPPSDPEAEKSVIGSLLIKPDVIFDIAHLVDSSDFHDTAIGNLFSHIADMHEAGIAIDVTTLSDRLRATGCFDAGLIANCGRSVANAAHAIHYAEIVHRHAQNRRLMAAASDAYIKSLAAGCDPQEASQGLRTELDRIDQKQESGSTVAVSEAIDEALAKIRDSMERGKSLGLTIGLDNFDREIGGLFAGELITLAARPGCGKTSLGLQIAFDVAMRDHRVFFASLEMSSAELVTRYLAGEADVDGKRIRANTMSSIDLQLLEQTGETLKAAKMVIDDNPQQSVATIRAAVHRMQRRGGLSLVVVDYIARVQPADTRLPRHEQVSKIAEGLKQIARELPVPVLMLCQLKREVEGKGGDGKPRLSDLRESGKIEEESDVVMFIHKPATQHPGDPDLLTDAELIVDKNRNGPAGSFELHWDRKRTRFSTKPDRMSFSPEWDNQTTEFDAERFE